MFKIIFLVIFSVTVSTAVDYCDKDALECTKGDHIGCGSTYDFDPKTCHIWPGVQRINLSQNDKNQIVWQHNYHRDQSARGNIFTGTPIAGVTGSRLCKMQWSEELETTACFNVWKCKNGHDKCRNTESFNHAGQNIYYSKNTLVTPIEDQIPKMVNSWNDEYKMVEGIQFFQSLPSLSGGLNGKGHFSQVVKDKACFVGCCAAGWQDGDFQGRPYNWEYWLCNYSFSNMQGEPLFPLGATAQDCETGPDTEFPGLCSINEKFDFSLYKPKNSNGRGNSNGNAPKLQRGRYQGRDCDDDNDDDFEYKRKDFIEYKKKDSVEYKKEDSAEYNKEDFEDFLEGRRNRRRNFGNFLQKLFASRY